jgi:putative ABC transport system permease protein
MFKNYLKIALRQLRKQKFYSAIKIGGFALGIATCLLIALFIRNELSYDRDYPDAGRIYRVTGVFNDHGTIKRGASWQAPLAAAIKNEIPGVEQTTRLMSSALFWGAGSNQFRRLDKDQDTYEEGFAWADSTLPAMFGMKMVYGVNTLALSRPFTLLISRRKANKYFPGQDPVGKQVVINDEKDKPWTIGGVMEDPSEHSHLGYDFYLSMTGHGLWDGEQQTWFASNYVTYLLLKPGVKLSRVEEGVKSVMKKYWYTAMVQAGNKDADLIMTNLSYYIQPMSDIHINADIDDGLSHGDKRYIWLFGAVAAFILLLACINFINLSTARSAGRAKEVGLRKVVGSRRSGLVQQFLLESLVLSLFSFLLAIGLAWALLPLFNRMAGTSMHFPWTEWWLAPGLVAAAVVVGVFAGLYPSFYLSAFRPALVLKGVVGRGSRHSGLRSVLVVFQFTTSVILIIATMVVYSQMKLIMNKKMGFDKDQVVLIEGTGTLDRRLPAFKGQLQKLSGVKAVTISDFLPVTGGKRNFNSFWNDGKKNIEAAVRAQSWWGDVDYLSVMGMKIAEGRSFLPNMPSDSQAVIVNQAFVRQMGWKDPIGKKITNGGPATPVIGVVEDFNFESVKQDVGPLCLHLGRWSTIVAVKTGTADLPGLIAGINGVWKSFSPQQTLRYTFLDDRFARMYADVQRTGNIFTALSTLAVIIACLGLFALSAFMAEQRRKEMGIRKVLGATVMQVMGLLSRDFLRLVGIAFVIASPIAYLGMNKWLQDYVYRIDIGVWMFAGAGALVVVIALATISLQALRAATANPVGALRSE